MSMSTGGSGGGMMSEINVTPLVDVMLVLLIIFMVAAPMLQTGVPVTLPKADAPAIQSDEGKLIITIPGGDWQRGPDNRLLLPEQQIQSFVDRGGAVYLVKTPFPFGPKLAEALKGNAKLQQEGEIYVHADQALPYAVVVKVMTMLSQNGGTKIGLVTDPLGKQ